MLPRYYCKLQALQHWKILNERRRPCPPSRQFSDSIRNISQCLKPGGLLLFRDYGHLDDSQLHLLPSCVKDRGRILDDNTYVKQDGTICHYFSLEEVKELFVQAGFDILELEFIHRQYCNRAQGKARRRIWCHGKFRKKVPNPER